MNKTQKEAIATVILLSFFIPILMNSFKKKPLRRPAAVKKDIAVEEAVQSSSNIVSSIPASSSVGNLGDDAISAQRVRANGKWGRDPFQLSSDSTTYSGLDLQLKGVSLGKDGKNFAFINQNVVTTGDTIGDFKVLMIEKDRVLMEREGKTFYLALPQE